MVKLDHSLLLDFALKLGSQKDSWTNVWQYFANAPHKFPKVIEYLNQATPTDLGPGMFKLPSESWPSVNAGKEKDHYAEYLGIGPAKPRIPANLKKEVAAFTSRSGA